MTPVQARLFAFIDQHIRDNGHSPSYRDMMTALDAKSPSRPHAVVADLIRQGWLRHAGRGLRRTIEVARRPGDVSEIAQLRAENAVLRRLVEQALRFGHGEAEWWMEARRTLQLGACPLPVATLNASTLPPLLSEAP